MCETKPKDLKQVCSEHSDMPLDSYCSNHDCILCQSCIAVFHQNCKNILPLDVASKGIRTSAVFDETRKEVTYLIKTVTQLMEYRKQSQQHIMCQKDDLNKTLAAYKSKLINQHCSDDMETKIKSEIESIVDKYHAKYEMDIYQLQKSQHKLNAISDQLDSVIENGSESQIFILMNAIQTTIKELSNELDALIPSLESCNIVFKPSNFIRALNSSGSIEIKSIPCTVSFKPPKLKQAQIQQINCHRSSIKQRIKNIELTPGSRISAIAITNNNRLILGDYENKILSLLNKNGQCIKSCALSDHPFGIAITSDTKEAVVTLPCSASIQFVDISSMNPGRLVDAPEPCWGIAVIGDKIVLGGSGKVYFITMEGKWLKTLNVGSSVLYPLCPGTGETLYCCQTFIEHKLYCVKYDGTIMFTYTSKEFEVPSGIATDNYGNLYVTARGSNNVHRLSPSGTFLDIFLTERDGLQRPSGIAFSNARTELFVPNKALLRHPTLLVCSFSQ